jgi:hypothetical protein
VRALAFVVLSACAPSAMPMTPEHPANPSAPTGRLAGPPPALRPGVLDEGPPLLRSDPPKQTPPTHEGHKH